MAWAGSFPSEFGTQSAWPDGTTLKKNDGGTIAIRDLAPQTPNITVVGIVLSKQEHRIIMSKITPGQERAVFSFVLRDSPMDFISCSCWGSEMFIKDLSRKFKIGDTVQVHNPQIINKPNGEVEEKCRPWTPVNLALNASEKYSTVSLHDGWGCEKYSSLAHLPIRENNDFYSLDDIMSNGQNMHGQHVHILAMVKKIKEPKDIVTKNGRNVRRCEIILMDETCYAFSLILWDNEVIDMVLQNWMERETVVSAVEVLAKFDDFRKTMTATVDSKTIFITNPDTKEAHALYKFGKSVEEVDDEMDPNAVDLATIKDVYNMEKLQSKLADTLSAQTEYGIAYIFITSYDLDGPLHTNMSTRCSCCKRRVDPVTGVCTNGACTSSISDSNETILTYDIRVNLSDHTGSIPGIYLGNLVAEQMIGCPVDIYTNLTDEEKTQLKWKFLFERCKIYFKVVPSGFNGARKTVRLMSCEKADPQEVYNHIKLA